VALAERLNDKEVAPSAGSLELSVACAQATAICARTPHSAITNSLAK
jgi:hypothetical protein